MGVIERRPQKFSSISLNTAIDTTPTINMKGLAGGVLECDGTDGALVWYTSRDDENFYLLKDSAGVAVTPTSVTAGESYPIPIEAFGSPFIRIVASAPITVNIGAGS